MYMCVCVLSLFIHTINRMTRRELSPDWLTGLLASSLPGGFYFVFFNCLFLESVGDDDDDDGDDEGVVMWSPSH